MSAHMSEHMSPWRLQVQELTVGRASLPMSAVARVTGDDDLDAVKPVWLALDHTHGATRKLGTSTQDRIGTSAQDDELDVSWGLQETRTPDRSRCSSFGGVAYGTALNQPTLDDSDTQHSAASQLLVRAYARRMERRRKASSPLLHTASHSSVATLQLKLHRARELKPLVTRADMDICCAGHIDGQQLFRSAVCHDTVDPVWEEDLLLEVPDVSSVLVLHVLDHARSGDSFCIGTPPLSTSPKLL